MIGLTGATGYIGKAIYQELLRRNLKVRCYSRSKLFNDNNFYFVKSYDCKTDWTKALSGIDIIIHCAGISGNLKGNKEDIINTYNEINTEATYYLANEALKSGVKRFIYLSSIKVNGESNLNNEPFRINDNPSPQTYYSKSKFAAEKKIRKISQNSNLEVVIVRSPAVYNNYGSGNVGKLIYLIKKGFPLPFKSIKNKRSFISLVNLVDFIILCISSPSARNEIFFVSDDNDISTPQLIKILSKNLNKPCILFHFPPKLIKFIGYFTGTLNIVNQLISSLQVDISYTKKKMGWKPKIY